MTTSSASPRLDGVLGRDDAGRHTLTFVRRMPGALEQAWEALVSIEGTSAWAPYAPDRRLDSLGPVTLRWHNSHEEPTTGRVLAVDPPHRLVMDWGDGSLLHWTLRDGDGSTQLTLVHVFDDRGEAPSYGAGWEVCLTALTGFLAGRPTGNPGGDKAREHGWQQLFDGYREVFDRNDSER